MRILLFTYYLVKLALKAVLDECNRLAYIKSIDERQKWLKSNLFQLSLDFQKGIIDKKTFDIVQSETLVELDLLTNKITFLQKDPSSRSLSS